MKAKKRCQYVLAALLSVVMSLFMLVGLPVQASAADTAGESYSRVTKLSDVTSGGSFVVVAEYNGSYYAMSNYNGNYPVTARAANVTDGTVSVSWGMENAAWTVAACGDGISLYGASSYLGYNATTNKTSWSTTTAYEWAISANDDGTFRLAVTDDGVAKSLGFYVGGSDSAPAYYYGTRASDTTSEKDNINLMLFKLGGSSDDKKVSEPGIEKYILDSEGNLVTNISAAAGQEITFVLKTNVPEDLINYIDQAEGYVLTFHDDGDDILSFANPDNPYQDITVAVNNRTVEEYYGTNLEYSALNDGCTFHFTMDLARYYDEGVIYDFDIQDANEITLTYQARVADDVTAGEYTNSAKVTYTRDGVEASSVESVVTVDVYGIKVYKYAQDDKTQGLEGATFGLYSDESCTTLLQELTTDESGNLTFEGLAAGTYYLAETEAPDGYVKGSDVVTVILADDAGSDNYASAEFANSSIPHTGDTGTSMFTAGGIGLIAAAGLVYLLSWKKREAQD